MEKKREKKIQCGTSSVLMWCPLLNSEGLHSLLTNTWWNTDFTCADNKTIMAIHFLRGQKPPFYSTQCSNKTWINWVNFICGVCDTVWCFRTMSLYYFMCLKMTHRLNEDRFLCTAWGDMAHASRKELSNNVCGWKYNWYSLKWFFIVFKHQILKHFPVHQNSQICLYHVGQQPQERFQTR